jgi:hypothetical protein
MKKTLILCGLVLAVSAPPAMAAGVNLNWNDCIAAAPVTNVTFACNVNTAANTMVGSFVPPAHIDSVCATEIQLNLRSQGPVLPAWWDFTTCRAGALTRDFNFSGGPFNCSDHWAGNVALSDLQYQIGTSGPNTATIKLLAAVAGEFCSGPTQTGVDPGIEYYGFKLTVLRTKTVGTGLCAGCPEPVCVVLNEVKLYSPARGTSDVFVTLNNPDVQGHVTWQGGAIGGAGCPAATPTRNKTWGAVKTLYR